MKKPLRFSRLRSVLLLAALPLATLRAGGGDTYIWTGGTGNYDDGTMWQKPDPDVYDYTFPGDSDTQVFIDGGKTGVASVVTVSGANAPNDDICGSLTIDAGDTLVLNYANFVVAGNGAAFTNGPTSISGTIVNNGTILYKGSGFGINFGLGYGNIIGTGVISMNDPNQDIDTYNTPGRITIGQGQTIQGAGNLGNNNANFTNSGLVVANLKGGILVLQPGYNTVDFTNTSVGVAEAAYGGILELNGSYGNALFTGGEFVALDGSQVMTVASPTVSNTTISTTATGAVVVYDAPTFTNVTLQGNLNNEAGLSFSGVIGNSGILNDDANLALPAGLTIQPGGVLNMSAPSQLHLTGTIQNGGTINMNDGPTIFLQGPSTFAGPGTINLNGVGGIIRQAPNEQLSQEGLTIGAGQIIQGQGNLGGDSTTFTNGGLINANVSGQTLIIQPDPSGDFTISGAGSAEASNSGILQLDQAQYTGGSFQALDGSQVVLSANTVFNNTTFATSGSGKVAVSSTVNVTDVTSNGTFNIPPDFQLHVMGTLTNNGALNVSDTSSTGSATVFLVGPVTLAGSGTVFLNDNGDTFADTSNANLDQERLTIGAGQTIAGAGNLGQGQTTFTNNGTINANLNGQTMLVAPDPAGDFTNGSTGIVKAAGGGTLELSAATFDGGLLLAEDGSTVMIDTVGTIISNATLQTNGSGTLLTPNLLTVSDTTLYCTLNIANNGALQVKNTLTNYGTVNLTSTGTGSILQAEGAATLEGSGTINLTGVDDSIVNTDQSQSLTNGASHSIQGSGKIYTSIINNGTIRSGGASGTLNILCPKITNSGTLAAADHTTLKEASTSILTNYKAATKTLKGGTFMATDFGNGASLDFPGKSFEVNAATVVLSGPNANFAALAGLKNNKGSFSLLAERQFSTMGKLTNEGSIDLDAGSTLHVAGAFEAMKGSTLAIVIGGKATSGENSPGILQANGDATLAGTLNLSFANPSFPQEAKLPTAADKLTILSTNKVLQGHFANVAPGDRLATTDKKGSFQVDYGSGSADGASKVVLSHFKKEPSKH